MTGTSFVGEASTEKMPSFVYLPHTPRGSEEYEASPRPAVLTGTKEDHETSVRCKFVAWDRDA